MSNVQLLVREGADIDKNLFLPRMQHCCCSCSRAITGLYVYCELAQCSGPPSPFKTLIFWSDAVPHRGTQQDFAFMCEAPVTSTRATVAPIVKSP